MGAVGIIANPYSSKDIRRLVGSARIVADWEKVNILRRIIIGLQSTGVDELYAMNDSSHLIVRACDYPGIFIKPQFLDQLVFGNPNDTMVASKKMAEIGVKVLISLGGDGTNRMIAKGNDQHCLLPVSTGTNNVFPYDIEGTHMGLCAGLLATGAVEASECTVPSKQIIVTSDDGLHDIALVDLAISYSSYVAARAIWNVNDLYEVFLTRCEPLDLGLASVGARLHPITVNDDQGLAYKISNDGNSVRQILAPIGPGTVQEALISEWNILQLGEKLTREISRCTLAFDGERETQIINPQTIQIEIKRVGPYIVDVKKCIQLGINARCFDVN